MKTRNGFVSNSSSSSFIIAVAKDDPRIDALEVAIEKDQNEEGYGETDFDEIHTKSGLKHYIRRNWCIDDDKQETSPGHMDKFESLDEGKILLTVDVDYNHRGTFDFIMTNFTSEEILDRD
ncbi:MAG: hypothetical protein ACRCWQ_02145 [Bacilli bacterium]